MGRKTWLAAAVLLGCLVAGNWALAAAFEVKESRRGAEVLLDGQRMAEYVTCSGNKPILWPIIGPTGKPMTRAYPMANVGKETRDHVHHRSLWFTHGEVNGVNFWAEDRTSGKIVHRKFTELRGGSTGLVATENDWLDRNGKKVLEDRRKLTFGVSGNDRWIDFDITLLATAGPATFGDTKEGMFAVRVAESMNVVAKLGGKITNSRGQVNDEAWGKPAEWVDYVGPLDGKTVGIAILNHPSSFRAPTHWHVRTYGLFAANPFGWHDFPGGEKLNGAYTVAEGKSISFFYRVLLHTGTTTQAAVAEAYQSYRRVEK